MNAKEALENFPDHIKKAYGLGEGFSFPGINRVVLCGMGASGIAGDILHDVAGQIPVEVSKDYRVPHMDEKTLAIISSYSGNTEEALWAYSRISKKAKNLVAITSGGMLESEKNRIAVPQGLPPRFALAYLFFPLLRVLQNSGIQIIVDINETESVVRKVDKGLARECAKMLKDKTPLVYAHSGLRSAALRFQTQINENPKKLCHANIFPELNHNEIEIFGRNGGFFALIFRDDAEDEGVRRQIEASKDIIRNYREVWVKGESVVTKIFYAIHFGDILSCYLAELLGIIPEPTPNIDMVKRKIIQGR